MVHAHTAFEDSKNDTVACNNIVATLPSSAISIIGIEVRWALDVERLNMSDHWFCSLCVKRKPCRYDTFSENRNFETFAVVSNWVL